MYWVTFIKRNNIYISSIDILPYLITLNQYYLVAHMYKVELGKKEDYRQVEKILWRAFEIDEKFEPDKKEDAGEWWNKEGHSRSYVIKDEDRIVANMSLELFPANIRGSEITVVGIGAVATEPTHRRKGMIRALFETAFQSMRENGEIFSMLDPFKIDYYRKFGYANAETMMQYRFNPSNIISLKIKDSIYIREAVLGEEKLLMDLQRSSIQKGSRLYLNKVSIKKRIETHNCYIVEEDGKPSGWFKLYFIRDKTKINWEDQKLTMVVSLSLFYDNFNVLNSIFNFLSGFTDQVNEIRVNSAMEIPVIQYINDRRKIELDDNGSMMIRVINFKKYIETINIPISASDSVTLTLKDEQCSWNSGTYKLTPNGGKLNLDEVVSDADIIVTDQQFSRIVSGLNSTTTLQLVGIIDCSFEVARKLESIFSKDDLMSYQRF